MSVTVAELKRHLTTSSGSRRMSPRSDAPRGQHRTINDQQATGSNLPAVAADLNPVAEALCTNLADERRRQRDAVDLDGRVGSEAESYACHATREEQNRADHSDDEAPRH